MHTHGHTYIHTHKHTNTQIHTLTHIHIHTHINASKKANTSAFTARKIEHDWSTKTDRQTPREYKVQRSIIVCECVLV
jgi:hypothetical protein